MEKVIALLGLIISIIVLFVFAPIVESHGRLMQPGSRSSLWRLAEFADQEPPPNYTDNQLFCGGVHQEENPGRNCGPCGDPLNQPKPRDNEIGGIYYKGIIARVYPSGGVMDVIVEITAAHKGFMEWRLCTNPLAEIQDCFDEHLLQRVDGQGTQVEVDSIGTYEIKLQLPKGVSCNHCILQFNYRAGNNWGFCDDGSGRPGCGPQETFRGCADIRISHRKL